MPRGCVEIYVVHRLKMISELLWVIEDRILIGGTLNTKKPCHFVVEDELSISDFKKKDKKKHLHDYIKNILCA